MCDIVDLKTCDSLRYVFFPVSSSAVRFKVKATSDVHVCLTSGPYENNPMTEIHIGSWDNTKTTIRRDRQQPDKAEATTVQILNQNEFVGMWIRWYNNHIAAGLEGSDTPFISYKDPFPHPIDHVAFRTGWGPGGEWKIEVSPAIHKPEPPLTIKRGKLHWVRMTSGDDLPPDAVIGGFEGEVLYVARARHNRSLCPGKYSPSRKKAYVAWGHLAHEKDQFEILCGYDIEWVKTKSDCIPPHAFVAGIATETNNERLYIGRAFINNNLIPGKAHLHYKTCYIPYNEKEVEVYVYEVLAVPDNIPKSIVWPPVKVCTDCNG